jgi:hypothetical protein
MTSLQKQLCVSCLAASLVIAAWIGVEFGTVTEENIVVQKTGYRIALKGETFFSLKTPLIYTTNGKIFQDSAAPLRGKWSQNEFAKNMKPGETYRIRSNGINFLWIHKNIISAQK